MWGWDNRSNTLYPPSHKDVMGYCRPNWISSYTYAALAARSVAVNRQAYIFPGINPTRWHSLIAYGDGQSRWGGQIETGLQGGDTEPAEVLDAAGRVSAVDWCAWSFPSEDDSLLLSPAPNGRQSAARSNGRAGPGAAAALASARVRLRDARARHARLRQATRSSAPAKRAPLSYPRISRCTRAAACA